ncbi:MAG TPA: YciI family protein [Candidatus Saccharimonadia bacterium]|nr:YciI family protein [Candidatus Saccharimonadia bacterium]
MKNYVLIYYNQGTQDAPSEDVAAAWGAWFGKLGDKLVDAGNPFGGGAQAVTKDGVMGVKDMPATGYSIVKAGSMDDAVAITKDCPLLDEPQGAVCVYETMPM